MTRDPRSAIEEILSGRNSRNEVISTRSQRAQRRSLSRRFHVFVSFDWDLDKKYKFLLNAWDENPGFDFAFSDETPGEIRSNDISRIKGAISTKIESATHTLVIVGRDANKVHKDWMRIRFINWMNFEGERSKTYGNRIAVVKLKAFYPVPRTLRGMKYALKIGFNLEGVTRALLQA